MEPLQKFNRKDMIKAIKEAINEMSEEDAYTTVAGVFNLFKIFDKYYQNKYGSAKRFGDLFEYLTILQSAYLKKTEGSR